MEKCSFLLLGLVSCFPPHAVALHRAADRWRCPEQDVPVFTLAPESFDLLLLCCRTAISSMVTVAEILKSGQWAVESSAPSPPQWQLLLKLSNSNGSCVGVCVDMLTQIHLRQLNTFSGTKEGSAGLHQ